jgi:DNA-binding NarL/FixJ family response regulator
MIRIVIAGDIRLYREGLSLHLERHEQLTVVGTAADGEATIRVVRDVTPNVLLLDMAMRDSLGIVQELRRTVPDTAVIALTIPEADAAVIACAEAGVAGFVMREGSLADLVTAVISAARGEVNVSPRVAATLLRRVGSLAADRTAPAPLDALTARERDIAALVSDGCSNKEIAARLHVELATVKNHVHNILEKLQVGRRGEIAARLRPSVSSPLWPDTNRLPRELRS